MKAITCKTLMRDLEVFGHRCIWTPRCWNSGTLRCYSAKRDEYDQSAVVLRADSCRGIWHISDYAGGNSYAVPEIADILAVCKELLDNPAEHVAYLSQQVIDRCRLKVLNRSEKAEIVNARIRVPVVQDPNVLQATVTEALSGHRCVSGWLGYGRVLLLGFGSEQLPERDASGRRSDPPYELQTSDADWRIWGAEESADSNSDREVAERAVRFLVGRPVVHYNLIECRGLAVEFDGGWRLEVLPHSWNQVQSKALDQWWFSLPGSRCIGVGGGGSTVMVCVD